MIVGEFFFVLFVSSAQEGVLSDLGGQVRDLLRQLCLRFRGLCKA